jgi:hypothetical protein
MLSKRNASLSRRNHRAVHPVQRKKGNPIAAKRRKATRGTSAAGGPKENRYHSLVVPSNHHPELEENIIRASAKKRYRHVVRIRTRYACRRLIANCRSPRPNLKLATSQPSFLLAHPLLSAVRWWSRAIFTRSVCSGSGCTSPQLNRIIWALWMWNWWPRERRGKADSTLFVHI